MKHPGFVCLTVLMLALAAMAPPIVAQSPWQPSRQQDEGTTIKVETALAGLSPGNSQRLPDLDNTESNVSSVAARRSSSMEGNVWCDNGDGSFTSVSLIDGYSRLDQYLMGLRLARDSYV